MYAMTTTAHRSVQIAEDQRDLVSISGRGFRMRSLMSHICLAGSESDAPICLFDGLGVRSGLLVPKVEVDWKRSHVRYLEE